MKGFIFFLVFVSHTVGFAMIPPELNNSSFSVQPDRVHVNPDSAFAQKISVVSAKMASDKKVLRVVGQIIALANPSASLKNPKQLSWVELDENLSKSLKIDFNSWKSPVGTAVGLVWVPEFYAKELKKDTVFSIYRYGLSKTKIKAKVLFAAKAQKEKDESRVALIFALEKGQTWYPGTNLQAELPLQNGDASSVAMTSVLHEGNRDFVFKQISLNEFTPHQVWILGEGNGRTEILSDIKAGDKIIEAGTILLKPVLTSLVSEKDDSKEVRQD